MRLLKQFGIILLMTFLGEICHRVAPFPIPAGIYGLVFMFAALAGGAVRLGQVKAAADFLLAVMPPMFIPAGVGLITVWAGLREILIPVLAVTFLTTLMVMAVTGGTAQAFLHRDGKKETGGRKDEGVSV